MLQELESIPNICDVWHEPGPAGATTPPGLLIEVPHGATQLRHYLATQVQLKGPFPERLEEFFFVNTDIGTPECAARLATELAPRVSGGGGVLVVRCLIPRTFVDCNRKLDTSPDHLATTGLTPALPPYVVDAQDHRVLAQLSTTYHEMADRAYEAVCGNGGRALIVHSYSPRSVGIEHIDEGIVEALHRAYQPEVYETWPQRPDVDLITKTEIGEFLAPRDWVERVRRQYSAIGVQVAENASYSLHPSTMAYHYSMRYPGQILCFEINRGLLADPFVPFVELSIPEANVAHMTQPIITALAGRR